MLVIWGVWSHAHAILRLKQSWGVGKTAHLVQCTDTRQHLVECKSHSFSPWSHSLLIQGVWFSPHHYFSNHQHCKLIMTIFWTLGTAPVSFSCGSDIWFEERSHSIADIWMKCLVWGSITQTDDSQLWRKILVCLYNCSSLQYSNTKKINYNIIPPQNRN